jgi:opacity protein-like surface antigen
MRLSIITLASLLAAPVFAAPFEPGVYLGVNGGRASVSSKYADDSSDITLGAAIGYQYTPNFGFDVYSQGLSLNPLRGIASEAGYYPDEHYGVAVQGTIPLDEHFSFYGRAGIGRTKLEGNRTALGSENETDPMVGVGVSYNFNRHWSINLSGSYLTKTEVSLLSFGARFQF